MSSTNRGADRDPSDFYATPSWATRAILRELGPHAPESILEPGCGDGAILKVVREVWPSASVIGVELDEERAKAAGKITPVQQGDFLALSFDPPAFGLALGNPPFSLAVEFVEKARTCSREVVFLMRLAMLEGQKRAAFWRANPADVYVLPKRPSFSANGKTDSAAYAWFAWGPGRGGRWSRLELKEQAA